MPRPSALVKMMGSRSPSRWMYSNVKSAEKRAAHTHTHTQLLSESQTVTLSAISLTFTFSIHDFDQVAIIIAAFKLLLQVECCLPLNLIIRDAIVLVAPACSCSLNSRQDGLNGEP